LLLTWAGPAGQSNPGGLITYDLLADDLIGLIDALGLDRPMICGFSDGGQLASIVGIRRPELARAIVNYAGFDLFNPTARSMSMARHIFVGSPDATEPDREIIAKLTAHPQMGPLFELMKRDHDCVQGPGHWQQIVAQSFPRITQFCGYAFDDLSRTTAPTLILVGDRDMFCSVEEAALAYRALPTGELAVLPNIDHGITPAAITQTVEFLERRVNGAPSRNRGTD
jgi:3-oxoadipate enol-lactonase